MEEIGSNNTGERSGSGSGGLNFITTTGKDDSTEANRKVGRYQIRELLGLGGMGQVYSAYDPLLKREVALKLLNKLDPMLLVRFLQEAQFQARLTHPSICRVFEVDAVAETPFIAMERIHGKDLLHADPMTFIEKLKAMIEIAEAVQSAHDLGLIHRDLKPSNILLEKDGSGWRPRVLDFGLARDLGGGGLTVGSCLMGTPPYMAPEQCIGRESTFRSDIYSLGATFFAFLTGKPPSDPKTPAELMQRSSHDLLPLLRSLKVELPPEMEVILQKCLEDDPDKRYESADALAEDLRRLLVGEPILAQAPGLRQRLARLMRSQGIRLLTVATLLVSLFAAWGLVQGSLERSRQKVAEQFQHEMREIEFSIKNARTNPIHDIRPELSSLFRKVGDMESRLGKLGSSHQGSACYAIGYSYLILRDYENARTFLLKAWEQGERSPKVASALGRTIAKLFLERYGYARNLSLELMDKDARAAISREFQEPAKYYLHLGAESMGGSLSYSRGLVALLDGKVDEALELAKRAQVEAPWDYEMQMFEARVRITAMGGPRDIEEVRANSRKVSDILDRVSNIARSDELVYELQALSLNILAQREAESKTGNLLNQDTLARILAATEKGRVVSPDDDRLMALYLDYLAYYATYQVQIGEDPREHLQKAQQLAKENLSKKVGESDWAYYLAKLLWVEVRYCYDEGCDTAHFLDKVQKFRAMLNLAKQNTEAIYLHYEVGILEATFRINRKLDLGSVLDELLRTVQDLVNKDPNNVYHWNALGETLLKKAEAEERNGRPFVSWVDLALPTLERAIRMEPEDTSPRFTLIKLYELESRVPGRRISALDKAFQEVAIVAENWPDDSDLLEEVGTVNAIRAHAAVQMGQDPSRWVADGVKGLARGIALYPNNVGWYSSVQARLHLASALWAEKSGQNRAPHLAKAQKALDIACARHPQWAAYFRDEYKRAAR